jgi:hypothetical protein
MFWFFSESEQIVASVEAAKTSGISKTKLKELYTENGTYGAPHLQKYFPTFGFARMGMFGFGHKEAITAKVVVLSARK